MKKIANVSAYLFIFSVIILSLVSVLGIWELFSEDAIDKSFQTIGLLAFVAVIVLLADHFLDQRSTVAIPGSTETTPATFNPEAGTFKHIRTFTVYILIASVALLALSGVMAIWEVLSGEVLQKSIASIATIAFSSLVVVVTCLEREDNPILFKNKLSGGTIFLIIFLAWIFIPFLFRLFYLF